MPIKRRIKRLVTAALAVVLPATMVCAKPPSDQQKKQVDDAVPTEVIVKPEKPRKVLVFSRTTGFRHGSIETGVYALTKMGEATGAYTVVAT